MNMKRRPNHSNNNNGGGNNGGGGRHFQNRNRRFSRNGSSGGGQEDSGNVQRIRRNATANREKYNNMARDAMASGDRVLAEYYLQHAEHHFRVLSALPPEEQRFRSQPQQQDNAGQGHQGEQSQQPEMSDATAQTMPDDREEVEINTAATSLPSFITGVRDEPREPVRAEDDTI